MNHHDLSQAQDPLLLASLTAMERAAKMARQTAIQTNTNLVVVREGQIVYLSAQELRQLETEEKKRLEDC